MNALSRREEDTLLKTTKARALKECDPVVKGAFLSKVHFFTHHLPITEFAQCAQGRTLSVAWACRGSYKLLQDCMFQ
jgi:COX assembly protein 1